MECLASPHFVTSSPCHSFLRQHPCTYSATYTQSTYSYNNIVYLHAHLERFPCDDEGSLERHLQYFLYRANGRHPLPQQQQQQQQQQHVQSSEDADHRLKPIQVSISVQAILITKLVRRRRLCYSVQCVNLLLRCKCGTPELLRLYINIYLSIYGIYIAPLQGNYSEALPAQTRAKIKVLRSL